VYALEVNEKTAADIILLYFIYTVSGHDDKTLAFRRHRFSRVYRCFYPIYLIVQPQCSSVVITYRSACLTVRVHLLYKYYKLYYYAPSRYSNKKQLVVGSAAYRPRLLQYRIPQRERPRELCDGNPWSNHLYTEPIVVACR